jgi:hypothetical protein
MRTPFIKNNQIIGILGQLQSVPLEYLIFVVIRRENEHVGAPGKDTGRRVLGFIAAR